MPYFHALETAAQILCKLKQQFLYQDVKPKRQLKEVSPSWNQNTDWQLVWAAEKTVSHLLNKGNSPFFMQLNRYYSSSALGKARCSLSELDNKGNTATLAVLRTGNAHTAEPWGQLHRFCPGAFVAAPVCSLCPDPKGGFVFLLSLCRTAVGCQAEANCFVTFSITSFSFCALPL